MRKPRHATIVNTNPFNYLQIFKNTIGWSGLAVWVYGEADKAYDRAKAIIEHSKDIELQILLGELHHSMGRTVTPDRPASSSSR
jgi:hypothetical protein